MRYLPILFLAIFGPVASGAPATTQSAGQRRVIFLIDAGEHMVDKAGDIRARVSVAIGAMSADDHFNIVIANNQALVFRPVLLDATESARDLAGVFLRSTLKPAGGKWEITHQLAIALEKSPTAIEFISDGDLPDPNGLLDLARKAREMKVPINTTLRYKSGKYEASGLLRKIATESGGIVRDE